VKKVTVLVMEPYVLAHQGAWWSFVSDLDNVTTASSGGQQVCSMALRDAELPDSPPKLLHYLMETRCPLSK